MKNLHPVFKYLLLIFINTCPFALSIILYRFGATYDIFLSILIINLVIILNNKNITKPLPFILLMIYMIICELFSGWLATYLYYYNISSDELTPVVGQLITLFTTLMIFLAAIILGISKIRSYRKHSAAHADA